MTAPVPDITLDINLRNPGQFFACCGVLELASRLWPGSEAWFAADGARVSFQIATYGGHNDPLGEIVRRLCEGDELVKLADDHEAQTQPDRKPVVIVTFEPHLRLDWWLDSYRGGDKSELKVWAGQQTPERNFKALCTAWRKIIGHEPEHVASRHLFSQRWPMTGRFGFDPSASWEAQDVGFSPDEQQIGTLTSPATEILAAIGLQRCRPRRDQERRGRTFIYRAWTDPLPITVVPAAIAGVGAALAPYEFRVVMRNAQYGSFGWAKLREEQR
jgi:CRISPR-associated protein Csx14